MQKGNKSGSQLSGIDKSSFFSQSGPEMLDFSNNLDLGGQDLFENKKRGRQ
jgi:hypothetical protein